MTKDMSYQSPTYPLHFGPRQEAVSEMDLLSMMPPDARRPPFGRHYDERPNFDMGRYDMGDRSWSPRPPPYPEPPGPHYRDAEYPERHWGDMGPNRHSPAPQWRSDPRAESPRPEVTGDGGEVPAWARERESTLNSSSSTAQSAADSNEPPEWTKKAVADSTPQWALSDVVPESDESTFVRPRAKSRASLIEKDGRKEVRYSFDVRGYKPDNITITMNGDQLEINAKEERIVDNRLVKREYRRHVKINIPEGVNVDDIKSQIYSDGMLEIVAPFFPANSMMSGERRNSTSMTLSQDRRNSNARLLKSRTVKEDTEE